MEILDEYQDGLGHQSGPGNVPNGPSLPPCSGGMHHVQSDSPLSHQEEDLSDPDRQDEESGEELPQQPLQRTNHSLTDSSSVQTPLSHLNSLMSVTNPTIFAKLNKLEHGEMDLLSNKNSLEALQAAMSSGSFNIPFSFTHGPGSFLAPVPHHQHHFHHQQQQQQQQQMPSTGLLGQSIPSNGGGGNNTGNPATASSPHSSESSQCSSSNRNGVIESSLRNSVCAAELGSASSGQQHQQQQQSFSFEEQFKQVRQLYEINDDPKRREFLDDLFTFMQNKGSPINRLPIMAKSVLDLYELYNLVIARGGLVDVINKKLWQEIIKGLHLPSSITSAAFTLRTQYMKYLYPYECAKKNLSTPDELQVAIDGNKREGRRSNYGTYGTNGGPGTPMHEALGHQRGAHTPNSLASHLHGQLSPLSLVTAVQQAAAAGGQHQALHNGSAAHAPLTHHPHHPQQPGMMQLPNAGIAPEMFNEFMKQLQRDFRRSVTTPSRGDSESPQPQRSSPTREQAALQFEMSRFNIWNNFYTSNVQASLGYPIQAASPPRTASRSPLVHLESPEPQREALDLGIKSSSSVSSHGQTSPNPSHAGSGVAIKRELEHDSSPTALVSAKRPRRAAEPVSVSDNAEDTPHEANGGPLQPNTHIKITNRGDGNENSLVVSMELNGVTYQGVLFAQTENRSSHGLPESGGHTARRSPSSRNVVL